MYYVVTVKLPGFIAPTGQAKLDFLVTLGNLSGDEHPSLVSRADDYSVEIIINCEDQSEAIGTVRAATSEALKIVGQGNLELGPAEAELDL